MKELFANSIPYDQKVRGRMGGNPPQIIENIIPEGYGFYTTLVHPEKNDKMLSILIVKDFDELVDNNEYPNIKIKVIEHDFSEMSSNDNYCLEKLDMFSMSEYY
ncbi:hypothetical protein HX079_18305, partial [Myroides odoratimimus]|nr:hypothetical protein [Myroides odoratimimus]